MTDDTGVDPEIRRRAKRRLLLLASVLVGLLLLATLGGFVAGRLANGGGSARGVLFVLLGFVMLCAASAALLAGMAALIKRRTGAVVPPLWGADRATRKRVVLALKHRTELTGQDRALALDSARRTSRLLPAGVVILVVAGLLSVAGLVLRLVGGSGRWGIGTAVYQLAVILLIIVNQIVAYRRARAYLDRYDRP
jgi:hypothetical protein